MGLGLTPAANAQSVFQKIFGIGAPPNAVPVAAPRPRFVLPPRRYQSRATILPQQTRVRPASSDDDNVGPPDSGGPYKTVCVRACDGFYFPLRHNARQKNFASDVKSCRNACGTDARLFYYPLNGNDGPDTMVDLAGRKYSELPKAFAYRKSRVEGCACKPEPWSYEEARRHQSYADQEAIELAKDEAFVKARDAEAQAANGSDSAPAKSDDVAASDTAPVQMPEPAPVASDGSIDMTSALHVAMSSDPPTTGAAHTREQAPSAQPVAEKAESIAIPGPPRRRMKNNMHRAAFKTTAAPGGGKSKLIWPGDAR